MDSAKRFWLKAALGVVVLLLLDQGARNFELNNMVTQIQKSESQMNSFNEGAGYWYKLYADGDYEAGDSEREVAQLAGEKAPLISAYGAQVDSVYVFPWHNSIIRAKKDYLAHNDAWVSSLNADTVIDRKFGDRQLSQEISNTFEIVRFSLPNAVPTLDLLSLRKKVDDIVRD